jgi:hypothetical protein
LEDLFNKKREKIVKRRNLKNVALCKNFTHLKKFPRVQNYVEERKFFLYRVSQNSRIPNSELGREGPSEAQKILRKKNSLFLKKI